MPCGGRCNRTLRLAVCLQIDLAQTFVQLGERELEAGFQRVDVDRRQLVPSHRTGNVELVAEHELDKFNKHAVFGVENILEGTCRHICCLENLGDGCALVALFQKQTDTGAENPLFRGEACRCDRHGGHPLSSFAWYIYHSIAQNDIGCKSESAAKMELPAEVPYEKMLGIYKMIYVWHIFFGIFPVF